jgi:bifunctional non-homologous end joining protein LigD
MIRRGMFSPRPLARDQRRPSGFIVPCQPVLAHEVPTGPEWVHELKRDGYRMIARRDGERVRIWSRNGLSWTRRLPRIVAALHVLPVSSIILDGEAVCEREGGHSDFHGLASPEGCKRAFLFAFDVLGLDGEDMCPKPLIARRKVLESLLMRAPHGIAFSEHLEENGEELFRQACAMGLEGIISKRRNAPYHSGRSLTWRRVKCPNYERR